MLRERGLIAANAAPPPDDPDRPWFLSLLMGIAGWIAGLFVLVFLALAFDLDRVTGLVIAGTGLLCVAWVLYFLGRGAVFIDQLALALSIAGQLALTVYFFDRLDAALPIAAAVLGLQLIVFGAMPDRIARTIAAFFASIAWVFVVRFALRPHEGVGGFFDPDGNVVAPRFGSWTVPIEWLATWLPVGAVVLGLLRTETSWMARRGGRFARPLITGLLAGMALGGIAAEPLSMLVLDAGSLGRDVNGWALFPLLSIALALFAASLAFSLRSAGLTGLAIFAALVHLARFYYLYGTSLTWKSLIMAVTGALLLGAAWVLARRAEAPR